MYIELVWMAFASTAAAGILPLLPEPTELFAPDNGLLDLPPKPISALGAAMLQFLFTQSNTPGTANTQAASLPATLSTTASSSTTTPPSVSSSSPSSSNNQGSMASSAFATSGSTTASSSASTSTSGTALDQNYCAGQSNQQPTGYWLQAQDHTSDARGYAPYAQGNIQYPVYRVVTQYGAKNDGSGDQTLAIQNAINTDGVGGTREGKGSTNMPAEVFLPGGVYTLGSTLTLRLGTIIVGDPLNRPIIKASPNFIGNTLVNGQDPITGHPETVFMVAMRNVILDTTAIDPSYPFTALQWGIAQGCSLSNVEINMPQGSTAHIGIHMNGGSTIAVTDATISGGGIGIQDSNQQVNFKNIHFNGCRTGFAATGGFTVVLQAATFENCGLGIDMTKNSLGSMVVLDSTSINTNTLVKFHDSANDPGKRNSQIVIENLTNNGQYPIAVTSDGRTVLNAQTHVDTWIYGNDIPGSFVAGETTYTSRPSALLDGNGRYVIRKQPDYADYPADRIVNVKKVPGFIVRGDGVTDDATSLNAILRENAANCRVTYFPYGVYILRDTLFIPPGSKIVGEGWAVLSGAGGAFADPWNPRAVVKVGYPGDVGVTEIQNMRFTVAEVLPGAKLLEINMAGANPGDVGLWNTLTTLGGTADTTISTSCVSQDTRTCMAAFMHVHLSETSSAYIENHWGWTADHNLDGGPSAIIVSGGRGILIESTKATWLIGTSFEHNWLYQYNIHSAKNVYAGMMQTETPYMQGQGAIETVPSPWTISNQYHDPDYSWCAVGDQHCRSALSTNVDGGSNIMLYGSAAWTFFEGPWNGLYNTPCASGICQSNMIRVTNNPRNLAWYSISTKSSDVMVSDGYSDPREFNNPGGWSGVIQAYRQFT
ncbi:exo-beta-1,3-glucanase, putative [Talaromyces stipitatus ATCC 10500]|uniref:Exo-beta-1,3-glucanase, putative n=1 Tax=Talaromyces stipitatus (strain ATCC 10500 / CBS 375.48 / QM 6759 / NRRL 1006) TaxID=441959 RepID=B8MP19_TALSN|nr:exo-beta-1,3-glucanase, putative [Talaromyces stipitatus ATCC 10500]EED14258.1 exo-beta-1,3-glucanase, putative [Talaromyces stipitatus ATCC 10500]